MEWQRETTYKTKLDVPNKKGPREGQKRHKQNKSIKREGIKGRKDIREQKMMQTGKEGLKEGDSIIRLKGSRHKEGNKKEKDSRKKGKNNLKKRSGAQKVDREKGHMNKKEKF